MPEPIVAQLGRISGKLLQANLVRNGIDLSFRNDADDLDLLYLDVNNEYIGINNDSPTVNLDVTGKIFVADRMDLDGTTATFSNIRFNSNGDITSTVGPINIFTTGPSAQIEVREIQTDSFKIKDNYIESTSLDENIVLYANGVGIVDIYANVVVNGDVDVTGNINAYSNVRLNGQLIVGDSPVDTVVISPDFKQSIIPGTDNTYTFGSASKRWDTTWIEGTLISTQANIDEILITEQMRISGNTIDTIRSNDDLTITYKPGQGIILENLKIDRTSTSTFDVLKHIIDNPNAYGTSADDLFGWSVAISGDRAIVGTNVEDDAGGSDSGKAYIFDVTSGALLHTLNNPNAFGTSADDLFGRSVAISGNYAIVGAYQEDDAGGTVSGKAYIFDVTTGGLIHTLDNPNAFGTSANDRFGWSVAISGDRAIVSAYIEDDAGGANSGKAYIFDVTSGALLHTLNNPNAFGTGFNDLFGWSVAISGDRAIVGAITEDDAGGANSGKAYIFDVTTGGLIHTLDNPNAFGTSASDNFGHSVAISGNYAIVSAYFEDDAGGINSGKAYIFDVTSGALLHTLNNPNAFSTGLNDYFGFAVAISGDRAIVSASDEDDADGANSGKAYIFDVTTGGLIRTLDNPNAFDTSADDRFGRSVAISGNYAIVGAPTEDDAGGTGSGKVYVFGGTLDTDTITNLSTTEPLVFSSTGTGYLKFTDSNAMRIPFGNNAQRPFAEIGETRWNSDLGYLECFDGSVYIIATGGGTLITPTVMEELGHVYTLIFG